MRHPNHGHKHFDSQAIPSFASTSTEILNVIALLADSLQHLETRGAAIDPAQYELLVSQLKTELARITLDRNLRTLLSRYPAAAELYENMHYETNGLCMHSNEHAVLAERITAELLRGFSRDTI